MWCKPVVQQDELDDGVQDVVEDALPTTSKVHNPPYFQQQDSYHQSDLPPLPM